MNGDDAYQGRGVGRRTQWVVTVGAVLVGLGTVTATVVTGGADIGSVPSAAASTTDATPWAPRPATLPTFFPDMNSEVGGQGTVRPPTASSPVLAWAAKATDAGQDIRSAVGDAQRAIGVHDVAAAKAACQRMSNANDRLDATLPTPVRALTSEVQAVVNEIDAAASLCLNAGPNPGQGEIDAFTSHVNAALAHYQRAEQIGADNSGPAGRPGLMN
ncbi:MAG TPA: hypothetical protein VL634_00845 [Mycobacterium sp.]|jgi:hypothetical protein|nr:hypothetical protein [Mycobacterium sp.]